MSWKPVYIPLEGKQGLLGILWSKGWAPGLIALAIQCGQFRADRHELAKFPFGTCPQMLDELLGMLQVGRRRVFAGQWIRFEVQRLAGEMTLNMDQKITQPGNRCNPLRGF